MSSVLASECMYVHIDIIHHYIRLIYYIHSQETHWKGVLVLCPQAINDNQFLLLLFQTRMGVISPLVPKLLVMHLPFNPFAVASEGV